MMVSWCHGALSDAFGTSPASRLGLPVHYEPASPPARQPAWAASPAGMEIELNGTVAVLEPRLGRVGGFAVKVVSGVYSMCVTRKKVNSSLLNLAIGCHQADRPRLITAASHQHEDDPGRKSRLVPSI